uniref:LRRCT domain-containing protein n=1 Tax=Ciona savignyi TaxID=51511 RepID=H2ZAL7_CIOSA
MIDLSENKLSTLPATVFSNISQERLTVELWENQFVCDCKMKGIKAWIDKLDAADPMTEIRFKCSLPVRMRDLLSDNLAPDDFVCQKNDNAVPSTICQKCAPPGGQIALAVVLTFIVTALIGVLAWRCTFKRRYSDLLLY